VFLKTIFAVNGDLMIEVGQGPSRCQNEYTTQLRPFLDSGNGTLSEANLKAGNRDEVVFSELTADEVDRLKQQLEDDLELPRGQLGTPERLFSSATASLLDAGDDERGEPSSPVPG
jgi:hypothetical protein